jgi:hypothetical protein
MSIQNALNAITKADTDNDWRKSCYTCKSKEELLEKCRDEGSAFSDLELENAFNQLILKCQNEEQANRVNEIKSWFSLFQ